MKKIKVFTFKNRAAQGDIYIQRVDVLPPGLKEVKSIDGRQVVAHSETGHHHAFDVRAVPGAEVSIIDSILEETESTRGIFETLEETRKNNVRVFESDDQNVKYVAVRDGHADLVHHREFDTHGTLRFPTGMFKINRQQERTPEGWRTVID